ncbi:hypothetical protein LINPERHAP2_LOCUS29837 [Linum perenne]
MDPLPSISDVFFLIVQQEREFATGICLVRSDVVDAGNIQRMCSDKQGLQEWLARC